MKSIEEKIEDWVKSQFNKKKIKYFSKTESINDEIDDALKKAPSKKGGTGNNYPDIKYFINTDNGRKIPVMIEVKGTKGSLIKLNNENKPDNQNKNGEKNWTCISKYAVNGALHYAESIIEFSQSYKEAIAIGVNGWQDENKTQYELSVWYVAEKNLRVPKEIDKYTDISFLFPENLKNFINKIDTLNLTQQEIEKRKLEFENDIDKKLKDLNQMMHDELNIVVGARIKLIAGLIMAGLGVKGKTSPLDITDLKGESSLHTNDGAVVLNKIDDFLEYRNIPIEKRNMIRNELANVFLSSNLQEAVNDESKIKKVYRKVKENILPYINEDSHLDFTGKLFNVLNDWVDVPDGAKNDVVLTPRYVTEFMARLCRVNKDSYVWDYALGSGGFLISAMNLMIADVKQKIKSPEEQQKKILKIKAEQLLGVEKLPDIYLLAVLNMILMGDGSSNIIHKDSLKNFEGNYEQGEKKGNPFPADVFLLNPPYSAPGKGFIFVKSAFEKMKSIKGRGRGAVLIQENAGSGQGDKYTSEILKNNTLVASIHMSDIFCGKSGVQTAIYLFDVGTPHDVKQKVKFIDFSEDGYTRQNRKKSSQDVNLRNTDNATERYEEVINVVLYDKDYLNYYKDCYIEDVITLDGNDWTYNQHKKIDTRATEEDFKKTVKEYLAWRVADVIKNEEQDFPK